MGQWLRGMRHSYGIRQSVPYGIAAHYQAKALRGSASSLSSREGGVESLKLTMHARTDESKGGFVLQDKDDVTLTLGHGHNHHSLPRASRPTSRVSITVGVLGVKLSVFCFA